MPLSDGANERSDYKSSDPVGSKTGLKPNISLSRVDEQEY